MRGKLRPIILGLYRRRIIPAHAGQTGARHLNDDGHTDHPRACGANVDFTRDVFYYFGSSPRMRGKRRAARPQLAAVRIIPAHAGQTSR